MRNPVLACAYFLGEIQRGKEEGDKRPGRVVAPSCLIWKKWTSRQRDKVTNRKMDLLCD